MPRVNFVLNGKPVSADYEPGMTFLEVLRENCGITSAKNGCSPEGACGCCAVLFDGRPALSCLRKPENMEGHEVETLEGMPEEMRKSLGDAFIMEGGVQCGFCIPGILVRASHLVREGKTEDRDAVAQALTGHICRCTGYARILDGIQTAGEAYKNGGNLPRTEPRRHFYFGEEYGLSRNPKFAKPSRKNGVGDSPSRYKGIDQALGEKPFIDDMFVPDMLHASPALSAHPRAKILAIDTSAAENMPGVVRVLTAKDSIGPRGTGLTIPDLPIFVAVGETTCCVGDMFALVVADSEFHARKAAEKVEIKYEVLPPVTDPFAALEPGAPQVHAPGNVHVAPNLLEAIAFSRGDVDAALAKSTHVIEQTFQTQAVEPAFLEPEACLALPQGDGVKVYSQSQGSTFDHREIARVLSLPMEKVEVELASSGGSFGAKEEVSIQVQTALAAHLLKRPVKTVLTRKQSTQLHPKRHPMNLKYTVGADAEGHLLGVKVHIVGDTGAYAGTGGKCLLRAACHSCGPYRVSNVDVTAKAVFTNNPTSGAMRGFGSNQAQFAMEGIMDILAERVGVDGYDIRDRNILGPGDAFGTGQIMRESVGIRATLEAVKDIYKKAKYKGIGCGIKSTGIGNGTVDSGHVLIRVQEGGKLEILTGYTEMGQGLFTTVRQAVCEETGLSPEIMNVHWDKNIGAKCGETWASRATTLSCAAAQRAAGELAADLKHTPIEKLAGRQYRGDYVCDFTTRPGTPDALTNPTTHLTFSYATQLVILDDEGKLERVVAAHDVGHAINPKACAGQIEGGVHMGLGYALSEDFRSTNSVPDSLLLRDTGILQAKHTPRVDVILIEVPDEVGGYGAKGAGEIGLVPTAGAVAAALHSYDGIRRTKLPMDDAPAAAPSVPKSRKKVIASKTPFIPPTPGGSSPQPLAGDD
ncbi:MAG TPA: molybdopterin cofactor-binding domain-containing protein [Candidatus Acidoferrales bacterium]|jgi:xanthine dehydrogenase molybdenum-binding subunit|nr:molybdopterin cofactor-binding domain-containing protein [Candidatus Acidoferrales bacterium]